MIKINLIAQRKVKRTSDKGEQSVALGMGVVMAAAAAVYFLVHVPMADEIGHQRKANADLKKQNADIKKQTADLAKLQAAVKAAQEQEAAIEQLNQSRSVPAWMLWELSNILTTGEPTITPAMKKEIESNPNRKFQPGWDPKQVWIIGFQEKNGRFTMKGGARADSDMTQLALRLQASMFFENVIPEGGSEASRKGTAPYYEFTITGSLRY